MSLSARHRAEHELIEKTIKTNWLPSNVLLVHLAREHARTAPLEDFEGNHGLAVWIDWHDALHGFQVFGDEVLSAYDEIEARQKGEEGSDLVGGVRAMRERREAKV